MIVQQLVYTTLKIEKDISKTTISIKKLVDRGLDKTYRILNTLSLYTRQSYLE